MMYFHIFIHFGLSFYCIIDIHIRVIITCDPEYDLALLFCITENSAAYYDYVNY